MPTEACHRGDPQDLCKKQRWWVLGDGTDCQAWQQVPSPTKPPRENLTEAPGTPPSTRRPLATVTEDSSSSSDLEQATVTTQESSGHDKGRSRTPCRLPLNSEGGLLRAAQCRLGTLIWKPPAISRRHCMLLNSFAYGDYSEPPFSFKLMMLLTKSKRTFLLLLLPFIFFPHLNQSLSV